MNFANCSFQRIQHKTKSCSILFDNKTYFSLFISEACMKIAILVDDGFYRKLSQIKLGDKSAADKADELHQYCMCHLIDNQ